LVSLFIFDEGEVSIIKSRYQEMTSEIIKDLKTEELLEQPDCLLKQELNILDNDRKLTGGRVNSVYKINYDGAERAVKISTGSYRMAELIREAEVVKNLINGGYEHIVPKYLEEKSSANNIFGKSVLVGKCLGRGLEILWKRLINLCYLLHHILKKLSERGKLYYD